MDIISITHTKGCMFMDINPPLTQTSWTKSFCSFIFEMFPALLNLTYAALCPYNSPENSQKGLAYFLVILLDFWEGANQSLMCNRNILMILTKCHKFPSFVPTEYIYWQLKTTRKSHVLRELIKKGMGKKPRCFFVGKHQHICKAGVYYMRI